MKSIWIFFCSLLFFAGTVSATETTDAKPSKTRAEINATLDRVDHHLKELEVKSKQLSESARSQWESALADLKKNGQKIRDELKTGSAKTEAKAKDFWQNLKSAASELEKGVESAGQKIKGEK